MSGSVGSTPEQNPHLSILFKTNNNDRKGALALLLSTPLYFEIFKTPIKKSDGQIKLIKSKHNTAATRKTKNINSKYLSTRSPLRYFCQNHVDYVGKVVIYMNRARMLKFQDNFAETMAWKYRYLFLTNQSLLSGDLTF